MSLRKWNDNKGYSRGARGIDDEKGADGKDFVHPFRDRAAEQAMFGRCWPEGASFDGRADGAEHSGSKDTKPLNETPDYDTK